MSIFGPSNILIPKDVDLAKWSVIACDQYTSERDYWKHVREQVAEVPSTLHMIIPEAELEDCSDEKIASIHATMNKYLCENRFSEYANSYIYVERTLSNGDIRRGILGMVDLEAYSYLPETTAEICATEKTVIQRIPPRKRVRTGAVLDVPHVLLLADDDDNDIFSQIPNLGELPMLYSFDLMENGGHIAGWLLQGVAATRLAQGIQNYETKMREKYAEGKILYAVGDGNHSLAAAKACYEECKSDGQNTSTDPKRFALVELENIHDPEQYFEPIHRIVKTSDPNALLQALQQECSGDKGHDLEWYSGINKGTVRIKTDNKTLPVEVLQDFLDKYACEHEISIDYIHGIDTLKTLSNQDHTVGFALPSIEKKGFFQNILRNGYFPRKTFSMGHAHEKRYYLETRGL